MAAKGKFGPAIKAPKAAAAKLVTAKADKVTRSLQEDPYIPPRPTSGWMRAELDRLGIKNRGKEFSDEQLARILREHGYDVTHEGTSNKTEKDR